MRAFALVCTILVYLMASCVAAGAASAQNMPVMTLGIVLLSLALVAGVLIVERRPSP